MEYTSKQKKNMSKLRKLVSVNDLKFLCDLYRENTSNSTHAFYTLSNFIHWFEENPQIDHVHVYVSDNWRESGFFIILVRALYVVVYIVLFSFLFTNFFFLFCFIKLSKGSLSVIH